MGIRLEALEFDANDPERLAAFWAAILGRELSSTTRLPGLVDTDFEVRFVPERQPKPAGRHRMHFDLTSASDEEQAATVRRALELGASHLDVGQRGDEGHVVLADPEGNEFCVTNRAGCPPPGRSSTPMPGRRRRVPRSAKAATMWPACRWRRSRSGGAVDDVGGVAQCVGGVAPTYTRETWSIQSCRL